MIGCCKLGVFICSFSIEKQTVRSLNYQHSATSSSCYSLIHHSDTVFSIQHLMLKKDKRNLNFHIGMCVT